VDDLNAAGITNNMFELWAWDKEDAPAGVKVPRAAGGADGMKSLTEKLRNTGGVAFAYTDVVNADTFGRKINEANLALSSNLRIYEFQTWWYKLFSPNYIKDSMPKIHEKMEKLGSPGMISENFGTLIYADYNVKRLNTRAECAEIWNQIYKDAREIAPTATFSGNKYMLNVVDWVRDIPMSSTGYTFADESVPFYQMVVHGSIPYTAKPFNHFYDKQREMLQTIEHGAIPYYSLTYNDSTELRKLFRSFTTPYPSIKDDIIETYKTFNTDFAEFTTQYMTKHEKLTKEVVAVAYSGGKTIYINYSDAPYSAPGGVSVPPMDYKIV